MAETKLVVADGARPKLRVGRPSDWTRAMADRFAEELAETCNVTLAAQAIGRSIGNVYKRRSKDASFRAAWDQALAIGYSRLELMLLERALHGVEKVIKESDGTSTVMREYPDRVALTLLRMHRDNAGQAGENVEDEEYRDACERIIAKLERLRERDLTSKDEVETKAAEDRLTLIGRALRQAQDGALRRRAPGVGGRRTLGFGRRR